MLELRSVVFICMIGLSHAQYGPPKSTGPVKHRTTTTTQTPPSANEIFPEPGDTAYQPPPQYQPQPSNTPQPSYGYGGQLPAAQPGYPGQQPAAQPQFPGQQPPPQPNYPPQQTGNVPSQPSPGTYQPPPSAPVGAVDISNNPFINAGLSGKPVSSGSYQPTPQQPQPVPQPGYPVRPPSSPAPAPQPGYPAQPAPAPQPGPPTNPTSPQPTRPINIQGNPFLSGAVKPQPPQGPGPQPAPQPPPFKPPPPQGQPPLIYPDNTSYKPGQVNPPSYQPNRPNLPPYQPSQPSQQPNPQQPYQPGQQPYQPGPQQPPQPQPGQPPYQPGPPQPQPGQQPYQPGPQQPEPGQQPYQPGPYSPNKPGQQPYQPGPTAPQPGSPYSPTQPSQSAGPSCYGPGNFCVPSSSCYNGQITGNNAPEASFKAGQCSPGQVCCRAAPKATPYAPQGYAGPVTEGPVMKYTGPLNTTPPPECAAALKCVPESYCDEKGFMRDGPVALTREQQENKVPLSDCQNPDTGVIGKCCRDPNYKDPWPAGMMMMPKSDGGFDNGQYNPSVTGFDDGQYRPGQYPGEVGQPGAPQITSYTPGAPTIAPPNPYTIKKPLGVFGGNPTPFPVAPKPGQTHMDVFPQNEDKLAAPSYQQTAGPQPHPVPSPQAVSPSGPTSPYGPGITPSSETGRPDMIFPDQIPLQPAPLPGTYRPPLPSQPGSPQPQQPSYGQSPQGYGAPSPQPGAGFTEIIPGQQCGVRRPVPPTQPDETGFGEFPWHAVIQSVNNRTSICSAVIIAPNAVLTAAHCIQGIKPEEMVVKAGEWTLQQPGPKPSQSRAVGATAIHPVYNAGSLVKDQAVVVTEVPFQFDQHVDKVCLPSATEGPSTGNCYLTGFGRPALQNNSPGSILHKIPVTIVPKEQCENNLKQTHLGKYFQLNEGFACAAPVSEADLCKIDVGSPLVCEKSDGHYELAGIYSWDTKCSTSLPGVVASPDTEWINQVLSTPIDTLRAEQPAKPLDHTPEDIMSKPGFALGYGK